VEHVALEYLEHTRKWTNSQDQDKDLHWTTDCLFELELDHPELCLSVVVSALKRASTIDDVDIIAAGSLETIIARHGDRVIEQIEDLAKSSVRFRYALTGVWAQGQEESEIWQRVLRARAAGPNINHAKRIPVDDILPFDATRH
jgi:hypothetical protein